MAAKEHIPRAGGASPIAAMLAQRAQPPAMGPPPQGPPLNGMRGMAPGPIQAMRGPPPAAPVPTAGPPLAGATGQAVLPPALKAALLQKMYGGGAPGGGMPPGGAPPIGR